MAFDSKTKVSLNLDQTSKTQMERNIFRILFFGNSKFHLYDQCSIGFRLPFPYTDRLQ